jgi:hypothetical protein
LLVEESITQPPQNEVEAEMPFIVSLTPTTIS